MVTWSWNKRYFERLSERLVLLFLLRVQLEGFHKQQNWMSKCSAWLAESKQTSFTKIIAPNLLNMTYLFSFSCHLLWLFFSAQKKLRSDFILTNNLTSFWLALSNRGHNLDLADKKKETYAYTFGCGSVLLLWPSLLFFSLSLFCISVVAERKGQFISSPVT